MSKKTLPSIADFEDKKITSGLKFIIGGGKYEETPGGWIPDGEGGKTDYVADAKYDGSKIDGLCSHFDSRDAFLKSASFQEWCKRVGAEY